MRRTPLSLASLLASVCVLVASTGCSSTSGQAGPEPNTSTVLTPSSGPTTSTVPAKSASTPAAPAWPTPEDCVRYNPSTVTVHYEAGIYSINDGSVVVLRLHGGPGDNVGQKGLALAQRFSKRCFLGRANSREDMHSYIFDYWRDPSGMKPEIQDQDQDCSSYNRNNLTVEDMGSGQGWRVKDHDHVLQLFDTESDARNGKLVLSKYNQICFIGVAEDVDPDVVSYFL
jgi:hypothetical protein